MTTKNQGAAGKAQTAVNAFKKAVDDQLARLETMYSEIGRYEKQGIAQINTAIDEMAKLAKDTVDYSRQFSDEIRQVAIETTKRAGEMWNAVLIH
jgi:hypothetical protein